VEWPNGAATTLHDVSANQYLKISQPPTNPAAVAAADVGEGWAVRPNPFRSQAHFDFALGVPGNVEVSLYDAAGRAVRTLARGPREAGRHAVSWDGRTNDGAAVPPGVYLYEISTPTGRLSGKVTRIR
jgi:hypothetical protein